MSFGLEGEIDVECVCCFRMDVLTGVLLCCGLLFFFLTVLSGFRRFGVLRDSVLESVWGRVCNFVWGCSCSDVLSAGDCFLTVAELTMVVVFCGVIG